MWTTWVSLLVQAVVAAKDSLFNCRLDGTPTGFDTTRGCGILTHVRVFFALRRNRASVLIPWSLGGSTHSTLVGLIRGHHSKDGQLGYVQSIEWVIL